MRTNIFGYVLSTENRKKIVRIILDYPKRQWSCTHLEEVSKLPHATVFRTIQALVDYKFLKQMKVNKRDLIYELAEESLLACELDRLLNLEKDTAKRIAQVFVNKIKSPSCTIILFGSTITGKLTPESDIDVLIILKKHNTKREMEIQDIAGKLSASFNKTISTIILDQKEIKIEDAFIKSIKENHEILYGKTPFRTS